jgi:hypothetical protein
MKRAFPLASEKAICEPCSLNRTEVVIMFSGDSISKNTF